VIPCNQALSGQVCRGPYTPISKRERWSAIIGGASLPVLVPLAIQLKRTGSFEAVLVDPVTLAAFIIGLLINLVLAVVGAMFAWNEDRNAIKCFTEATKFPVFGYIVIKSLENLMLS
jgi:hypothetical protein